MTQPATIFVAGPRGMVGSAIVRQLQVMDCRVANAPRNDGSVTLITRNHTTPMQSHINVGYGSDISIADVARTVSQVVGYQGDIDFDTSQPDGTPRKLMGSSRLNALGWQAKVKLANGLAWPIQIS